MKKLLALTLLVVMSGCGKEKENPDLLVLVEHLNAKVSFYAESKETKEVEAREVLNILKLVPSRPLN